jgi:hypothetical protein
MKNTQQSYSEVKTKFAQFLEEAKNYRAVWEVRSYVNENFFQ